MQKNTIWIQTGWRLQVCVRCFEVSNITQVGNVSLPYCKTNIGKDSLRFQGRKLIIFHSTEFHNASTNAVFTSKPSCYKYILLLLVCSCVPFPPFTPFFAFAHLRVLFYLTTFYPKSWSFCLPMTAFQRLGICNVFLYISPFGFPGLPCLVYFINGEK